MLEIGKNIRSARLRQGLTQKELSDRVGIAQPSLSAIESGATETPQVATLRALAYELRDDFGSADLREYLDKRKDNPGEDLVLRVAEVVAENEFVLWLFVIRLARLNEEFRRLIDPTKLEEITIETGKALRMVESINTGIVGSDLTEWFLEGLDEEDLVDEIGPMKRAEMIITRTMEPVDGGEEMREEKPTRRRKTG